MVQITSLIGVGLLYEGTVDRHMVEVLLKEIGKARTQLPAEQCLCRLALHMWHPPLLNAQPPGDDRRMDRESYSLTAGLALGLVTLARGSAPGLADLHIEDRLHRSPFCLAIQSQWTDSGHHQRTHRYIYGSREEQRTSFVGESIEPETQRAKSNLVLEPGPINVDVTSPGATLALGARFLLFSPSFLQWRVECREFNRAPCSSQMLALVLACRPYVAQEQQSGESCTHSDPRHPVPSHVSASGPPPRARPQQKPHPVGLH